MRLFVASQVHDSPPKPPFFPTHFCDLIFFFSTLHFSVCSFNVKHPSELDHLITLPPPPIFRRLSFPTSVSSEHHWLVCGSKPQNLPVKPSLRVEKPPHQVFHFIPQSFIPASPLHMYTKPRSQKRAHLCL